MPPKKKKGTKAPAEEEPAPPAVARPEKDINTNIVLVITGMIRPRPTDKKKTFDIPTVMAELSKVGAASLRADIQAALRIAQLTSIDSGEWSHRAGLVVGSRLR